MWLLLEWNLCVSQILVTQTTTGVRGWLFKQIYCGSSLEFDPKNAGHGSGVFKGSGVVDHPCGLFVP